jgi:hypothetical protein
VAQADAAKRTDARTNSVLTGRNAYDLVSDIQVEIEAKLSERVKVHTETVAAVHGNARGEVRGCGRQILAKIAEFVAVPDAVVRQSSPAVACHDNV